MNFWAPTNLNELVGNTHTVDLLRALVQNKDKAPRGFIFDGPSGCGKSVAARLFGIAMTEKACVVTQDKIKVYVDREDLDEFPCVIWDHAEGIPSEKVDLLCDHLDKHNNIHIFVTEEASRLPMNLRSRCLQATFGLLSSSDLMGLLAKVSGLHETIVNQATLQQIQESAKGVPAKALVSLQTVVATNQTPSIPLSHQIRSLLRSISAGENPWEIAVQLLQTHSFITIVDEMMTVYATAFFERDTEVLGGLRNYQRVGEIFLKWRQAGNVAPAAFYLLIQELLDSDKQQEIPTISQPRAPVAKRSRVVVGTELDALLSLSEVTGDT